MPKRKPQKPIRPMAPARQDGRPLYFDVPKTRQYHCARCAEMGLKTTWHGSMVVMNDPANAHNHTGAVYTYCLAHIPENAVIFNPQTMECRDKKGKTWVEPEGPSPLRKG